MINKEVFDYSQIRRVGGEGIEFDQDWCLTFTVDDLIRPVRSVRFERDEGSCKEWYERLGLVLDLRSS